MTRHLTLRKLRQRGLIFDLGCCFVLLFNLLLVPLTDLHAEAALLQAQQELCLSDTAAADPGDSDNNGLTHRGSTCLFCGPGCTMGGCVPAIRLNSAALVTQPLGIASLPAGGPSFASLIVPSPPAPFHRAQAPPRYIGSIAFPSLGGCA